MSTLICDCVFVCVEVLHSQPSGLMSSAVSVTAKRTRPAQLKCGLVN